MWIPTKEAVERYGRSRQYLDKLVKTKGCLKRKGPNGVEYDTDSYDQYIGYNAGSCKPPESSGKKSETTDPPQKRKTGGNKTGDSGSSTGQKLVDVEIKLKEQKVIGEKFKNKRDEENSIDRDETETLFFQIATNVKNAMDSIPSRAATICVGKTRHEIEQILTEEMKQAQTNLVLNL